MILTAIEFAIAAFFTAALAALVYLSTIERGGDKNDE